jgi:superfamily II DNA helicase RecQ
MAAYRPASLDLMRSITGVGDVKLERYGQQFLDVLNSVEPESESEPHQDLAEPDFLS